MTSTTKIPGAPPATLTTRDEFFVKRPLLPGLTPTPRIIVGTAGFGGVWGAVNEDVSVAALHDAWANGFLFTDTAPSYARAEHVVGLALKSWVGPKPIIATKFGYETAKHRDYTPAGLDAQFRRSVERFNNVSPHAVAIHDAPLELSDATRDAAVEYLRGLISKGDVLHVGLGGGGPACQLRWLGYGVMRYLLTFNRVNACTVDGLRDSVPQAHQHNAKAFAASPLFMGLLGRRFDEMCAKPPGHVGLELVARAKIVKQIAEQAGLTLTAVALRFLLSIREIDALVIGASTLDEWRQTVDAYNAGPLPVDLFTAIVTLASPPSGKRSHDGG